MRINITGQQGNRHFLADRGVTFETSNPTVAEIQATIEHLRQPHPRHRGHRGCGEAADLLASLLDQQR